MNPHKRNFINPLFAAIFSTACLANGAVHAESFNFNPAWKFIKEDVTGAEKPEFNDGDWETVSAPHTYNDVDTFDDFHPAGHAGEVNQWGGKTWYRKKFTAPTTWTNKTVVIEFEAIRQVGEVFLNGTYIGKAENGFVPYGFDLSKALKLGQENVLAVRVDNEFIADRPGYRNWDKYEGGAKFPWNNPHWHPAHGGLYRNVKLHVLPEVHFTLPLYQHLQTTGIYTYSLNPSWEKATIGVDAEIKNDSGKKQSIKLVSQIIDMTGKEVLQMEKEETLDANQTKNVSLKGDLKNPRLWEPKHPYVYQVVSTIHLDGKEIHKREEPLGIRWFNFNPHAGLFINDRYVKMQGWGHKPTDEWPGIGAAQPDWLRHYTLSYIPQAGGNFMRWGHCAGGPGQIKASDYLGIVTIQPGVDAEKDSHDYSWEVRSKAFQSLIIYFRNNPSIVVWEGGNHYISEEHCIELTNYINKYDPHGSRSFSTRSPNATVLKFSKVGITMEGGNYNSKAVLLEGEYNREESPRRVWDRQTPGFENWHAEGEYDLTAEQFALNQTWQYDKIGHFPHGGGANWIYTDSTSGGRVTSETSRTSGELDGVRLPKEAYWVLKVIFTDEPDLHLLGHWNYPPGTLKNQYVVSDCEEVELIINGKSLGKKQRQEGISTAGEITHPLIFTWPQVPWQKGTVEAIGFVDGKKVASAKKATHGEAVALRMTSKTGPRGLLANGGDIALVDVEAVDADGNRCLTWYGKVDFQFSGPGKFLGGYNSGKEKTVHKPYLDLESGINRVSIRSGFDAGKLTLVAKSEGLQEAKVEIISMDAKIKNGIAPELPVIPIPEDLTPLPPPNEEDAKLLAATSFSRPEEDGKIDKSELIGNLVYGGKNNDKGADITKPGLRTPIYTDQARTSPSIHPLILNGEQIRVPHSDKDFWAADIVSFSAKKDLYVYVAHHDMIDDPEWLKEDFKLVENAKFNVAGIGSFQLYRKPVKAGDTVLLGENNIQGRKIPKRINAEMYLIYVVDQAVPIPDNFK